MKQHLIFEVLQSHKAAIVGAVLFLTSVVGGVFAVAPSVPNVSNPDTTPAYVSASTSDLSATPSGKRVAVYDLRANTTPTPETAYVATGIPTNIPTATSTPVPTATETPTATPVPTVAPTATEAVPTNVVKTAAAPTPTAAPTQAPVSLGDTSGSYDPTMAAAVLDYVNQQRANAGVPALTWNDTLTSSAQVRAPEIVVKWSHTRPNGSPWYTAGAQTQMGENLAYGQTSAEQVVGEWMASPGHAENILRSEYTQIGVVCYLCNGTYYWVQLFS